MLFRASLFSSILLGCSLFSPVLGQSTGIHPEVYPVPQKSSFTGNIVQPKSVIIVTEKTQGASHEKDLALLKKCLPNVKGAYRLTITPEMVRVLAHDDHGVFYAKQTLSQLLQGVKNAKNAQKDPFEGKSLAQVAQLGGLAECDIIDWPDLKNRGAIEGFYGTPWSHQARIKQLEFYGRNKMDTYVYGPKDDPYHHGRWREPYPAKEAKQIQELVRVAKKNHVNFVWAIHPGGDIKWTDEDMHNVIKKMELMYNLGVRSFSVFFDDIGGEGARGEKQSELLNMIHKEFVTQKKDVTDLVMCPTQYNRAWAGGSYLEDLGSTLDKSIDVFWTGNSVVHDITQEGQDWVNAKLKRPSYIWWNWPCTDFVRNRLLLGRTYGLTQDARAAESMNGFVSNPMDKPEASKIGLFGVGDYTWNIHAFNSDKSWREGIKRLFPECAKEMQVFADHNSDHGPNGHGYRREESVQWNEIISEARKSLSEHGNLKSLANTSQKKGRSIAHLFRDMVKASEGITEKCASRMFVEEAAPWLRAFKQLGLSGSYAVKALNSGNPAMLAQLASSWDEMDRLSRNGDDKFLPNGAATGTLLITPFVKDLADVAGNQAMIKLVGKPAIKKTVIKNNGGTDGLEKVIDGDQKSFWHSGNTIKSGDFVGLSFDSPVTVKTVELQMGKNAQDGDFISSGQWEMTQDGHTWKAVGNSMSGNTVTWSGKPLRVKGVRYVAIQPSDKWLAVREISLNVPPPASAESTVEGMKSLAVTESDKMVNINRVMEVHSMKPGDSITMKLPIPTDATWLEIDLDQSGIPDWAQVSLTTASSSTPKVQNLSPYGGTKFKAEKNELPKGITSVSIVNKGKETKDIKINMFKFDVPARDKTHSSAHLTDGNAMTVYRCDVPLKVVAENTDNPKAKQVIVLGTAAYSLYAQTAKNTWILLGKSDGSKGVDTFSTKGEIKSVRLEYAQPQAGKSISEIIFK